MMELARWNPVQELGQMQERLSRLFDDSFFGKSLLAETPTTDIYEEKGNLVVEMALPGFKRDEVEVNITDATLEIRAAHAEDKNQDRRYLSRESRNYYRFVRLPSDVKWDKAEASFTDGILRVELPMKQRPQPKKLELKSGK